MKSKLVLEGQERTFVLILDPAEEAFRSIAKFTDQENVTGASVTAIGAFEHAKLAGLICKQSATSRFRLVSSARS